MKKFILTLYILLVSSVASWATDVASITVGGVTTGYSTMTMAMAALSTEYNPATLNLLSDQTISNWRIKSGQNITFVGGNYTLTINAPIILDGALTVTDGTLKMSNYSSGDTYQAGIYLSLSTSELTLNSGTIDASASGYTAIRITNSASKLTINDGTVISDMGSSGKWAVYLTFTDSSANVKQNININGGRFTSLASSSSDGSIFKSDAGYVKDMLGKDICLGYESTSTSSTDSGDTITVSNVSQVTSSSTTPYVVAFKPVAKVETNYFTKAYKKYDNAWSYANVSGRTSTIYQLRTADARYTLSLVAGANITLESPDSSVVLNSCALAGPIFMADVAQDSSTSSCLTINSGKYENAVGEVLMKTTDFPVTINGGEFSTTLQNTSAISVNVPSSYTDMNFTLNGGKFNYTANDDQSTSYTGGLYISHGTHTAADALASGKAYWPVTPNTTNTPLLFTDINTNSLLKAVYVSTCPHDTASGSTPACGYCGRTISPVAKIDDTGYSTLEAAFEAATSGQTITLLVNLRLENYTYIDVTKSVTLDLNGHNLSGLKSYGSTGDAGLLHVGTSNITLTVTDSSSGTKGVITNTGTKGTAVSLKAGNVATTNSYTLSSLATTGNVTMSSAVTIGTLKVLDGVTTISPAAYGDITITSTTTTSGDSLVINAGTFGFDPTKFAAWTSSITQSGSQWIVQANQIKAILSVGETVTRCKTVYEALNNAPYNASSIIYLMADCDESAESYTYSVPATKDIEFVGNSYKWTLGSTLAISGSFTLESGTIVDKASVSWGSAVGGISVTGGTLTVYGGSIISTDLIGVVLSSECTFSIFGGSIQGAQTALSITSSVSLSSVLLGGGTFTPGAGSSAIRLLDASAQISSILLSNYGLYKVSDGTAVNTDTYYTDAGVAVRIMNTELKSFTVGNIDYKVTSVDYVSGVSYAAVQKYNGTIPENSSITIPATVSDPNNKGYIYTVDSIAPCAFQSQKNLVAVSLSDSITGIGERAFDGTNLRELTIPQNVQWIGWDAFQNNFELKTVYYNATNVLNNDYFPMYRPFYGSDICIANVVIGANVTSIPDYMFYTLSSYLTSGTVTCLASTAPTIGTNTFGPDVKIVYTLSTPQAKTRAQMEAYKAWGFGHMVTPTAVQSVMATDSSSRTIYDLNGHNLSVSGKMASLPKGVYIINGKKVTVQTR